MYIFIYIKKLQLLGNFLRSLEKRKSQEKTSSFDSLYVYMYSYLKATVKKTFLE